MAEMNRAEYEAAICRELQSARVVDFKKVSMGDWIPAPNDCHKNVERLIADLPGHSAVRGWVVYKECIVGTTLGLEVTAHSVVRDPAGNLFDITPVHDERQRSSMRFVRHIGEEAVFWELERVNCCICCPGCARKS
jgi:hypothetical protein